MKITHYKDVKQKKVDAEGAHNVKMRWLISNADGARNFAMRLFELGRDGATPVHTHSWEHEVYVLSGRGEVFRKGKYEPLEPGTAIHVPPDEKHCFRNTSKATFKFLCLIPV